MRKLDKHTDEVFIKPNDLVTLTEMNHVVEVQHMSKMNFKANIKKLDKDRYVDIATGEIREFEHSETRKDNLNSLRQTFKKLRYLINNNFIGAPNELHITLTYNRHVTDAKELYIDFDKFMKRLRYKYKNETSIDYLSVVEPQGSGRWHCHVLLKFNDLSKIYIPNKFENGDPVDAPLYCIWNNGYVTIKSLKDVDNIGAYLSAYLADVELTPETAPRAAAYQSEIQVKKVDGKDKPFVKGGRLHMYPPGMNLYRKSKGIIEPERKRMAFKDIKKVVGSAKPHYQKSTHIENDDFESTISYLQYNKKRK